MDNIQLKKGNTPNAPVPKVSVVVPIHNIASYLPRCIESLINQTLREIEIILVENGSTDNSLQICRDYQDKDNRIQVLSFQRGDVSMARNEGIKIARAPMIGFVDGDDWADPEMFEKLLAATEKKASAGALCYFIQESPTKKTPAIIYENTPDVASVRWLLEELMNCRIINSVWLFLFPSRIFKHLNFPDGKFYEDFMMVPQFVSAAGEMAIVKEHLYHYTVERPESTMQTTSHNPQFLRDYFQAQISRLNLVLNPEKFYPSNHALAASMSVWLMGYFNAYLKGGKGSDKEETQKLKGQLLEMISRIDESRLPLNIKMQLWGIRHMWPLYLFLARRRENTW